MGLETLDYPINEVYATIQLGLIQNELLKVTGKGEVESVAIQMRHCVKLESPIIEQRLRVWFDCLYKQFAFTIEYLVSATDMIVEVVHRSQSAFAVVANENVSPKPLAPEQSHKLSE